MQVKRQISVNGKSQGVFVGEILREGLGEDEVHKPCRELKMRGVWEGKTQEMTITFSTPICSWSVVDMVSGFRME